MEDEENKSTFTGTRRGDGGTYLVIYDDSEEFSVAMHYAAALAKTRRGHIAIAHITEIDDFVHWGSVEAVMKAEMRAKAEKECWQAAKTIFEEYGLMPCLYIREGKKAEKIIEILNEHKLIRSLILAASTQVGHPGPLVSFFTTKATGQLRTPVVIVPGHFDKEAIEQVINPLRLAEG